jgi:hypothetical protein
MSRVYTYSLVMLKSLRISSGVLPLIMFATVLHPTSLARGQQKFGGSGRTATTRRRGDATTRPRNTPVARGVGRRGWRNERRSVKRR